MGTNTARGNLITFARNYSIGQAYYIAGILMREPKSGIRQLAKNLVAAQLGTLKGAADACCEKCRTKLELDVRTLDELLNSFDDEGADGGG